jgi:two-component system, OmpR family, sensor kinase
MVRRLLPGGLRAQLSVAIAVITLVAVGAGFWALYTVTGTRLRSQVDSQLRTETAEWRAFVAHRPGGTPAALERSAAGFIAGQRYHAASLILAMQVTGGRTITNNPELLARDGDGGGPGGLERAPAGLSTATVAEAGPMRVLVSPIDGAGHQAGTFRAAAPLSAVQQAQSTLLRTFALVGTSALVLALAAGWVLASLISAPLRRIARVAAAVDAGDLSARAGPSASRGEVGALATAFDRMLGHLERSFRRQSDFVSDASHELRTPLTVLRAQVELLDREADAARRHQATDVLLARIDTLDRLVGDMLTLAGAEDGHLVHLEQIDLEDFFEDLRRDLPLYGKRDFSVEGVAGTLSADCDRITQVLHNLVRNAVAHTEPGGRIVVTATANGGRLRIAVRDDGPGIPADELEAIFERFHRVDPGRSRDSGGTGLGLAIARALTEAHGGTVVARSPAGEGATFVVELPGYVAPDQRPAFSGASSNWSRR